MEHDRGGSPGVVLTVGCSTWNAVGVGSAGARWRFRMEHGRPRPRRCVVPTDVPRGTWWAAALGCPRMFHVERGSAAACGEGERLWAACRARLRRVPRETSQSLMSGRHLVGRRIPGEAACGVRPVRWPRAGVPRETSSMCEEACGARPVSWPSWLRWVFHVKHPRSP